MRVREGERREGQRTRENGVIMKSERHTERTLPHHTQSGSRFEVHHQEFVEYLEMCVHKREHVCGCE